MRISAAADGHEELTVIVPAAEWSLWPGNFALVPLLGVPLSVRVLLVPILLPFSAAGIVVTWATVTSPLLWTLGLVRTYPDKVNLKLRRRPGKDPQFLRPPEIWSGPEDFL